MVLGVKRQKREARKDYYISENIQRVVLEKVNIATNQDCLKAKLVSFAEAINVSIII